MVAKIFHHKGSPAVHLPKSFHFTESEVVIEKRGDEIVLRPKRKANRKPKLRTLNDVARYIRENFPSEEEFPDIERTKEQQVRDLNLD